MPLVPITDPRSQWFVSCDEMFGNRRGTPYSMEGRRDYERNFLVVAKTHLHPNSVALCPFLPLPGSLYLTEDDYDLLALMIRMDCAQVGPAGDDYQNWVVTCQYSTDVPTRGGPPDFSGTSSSPSGSQNNPDVEFPDVSWDNETAQIPLVEDLDGQPALVSNERPVDPPPTFEVGYPVLQISRNEYLYNAEKAADWMFAVNDAKFLGYDKDCVQCIRISAPQVWRGKLRFFRVTYRIRFARKARIWNPITGKVDKYFYPWQIQYQDQDSVELQTEKNYLFNDRLDHIAKVRAGLLDPDPEPITLPIKHKDNTQEGKVVLLNGKGKPQKKNQWGYKQPYYIKRRVYEAKSFNDLLVKGVG